jgi:hypothetical protein
MLSAEVFAAVHRRDRVLRQPHADGWGQFLGTVIHHARDRRCALAQAVVAIAVGVIGAPLRRLLVASSRRFLLRLPRRITARVVAVGLAPEARLADREQPDAEPASLEDKQRVVHRPRAATTTNLPRTPIPSIVSSSRRPSAEGLRR